MRGNWCRDFEAGCPSSHQPVLKTTTGSIVMLVIGSGTCPIRWDFSEAL